MVILSVVHLVDRHEYNHRVYLKDTMAATSFVACFTCSCTAILGRPCSLGRPQWYIDRGTSLAKISP